RPLPFFPFSQSRKNCRTIRRRRRLKEGSGRGYHTTLYPLIASDNSFLDMAENKGVVPPPHDLNAKWDACLDLTLRRFVYSSFAGAFGGLLFFRSPVTRWASIAFGAGLGIGSAYTDCNSLFQGSTAKFTSPKITEAQPSQ
uniref:MICOS complex subunit MIC10 n=2 Tax=Cucumis melo TaxID=3656 RepID=A0A9I9DQ38_CUCME